MLLESSFGRGTIARLLDFQNIIEKHWQEVNIKKIGVYIIL